MNFSRAFPRLCVDDAAKLARRLEEMSDENFDFYFTMAFSTGLASLGLLQNSVAVVIGAMIVAPLMNPLLTSGLALVRADARLFRKGLRITALGVIFGLSVSLLFGFVNPGFEPTMEIEARGTPDLLDLGIALISGMTAAYALSRPNVLNIIAGVAIAAALIPPLSVVGLSLAGRNYAIAGNAAILLATNLVAIIIGASAMFRMLGVNEHRFKRDSDGWVLKAIMLLSLFSVLLIAPLFVSMVRGLRVGQNRPLSYPVSPRVRDAVAEYMEGWPQTELIMMARYSAEPRTSMAILVMASKPVGPEFEKGLRRAVLRVRSDYPHLRIFVMASAVQQDKSKPGQ